MRIYVTLMALMLGTASAQAGDICREIRADAGWQSANFPFGLVDRATLTGTWSTSPDAGPVGANGYQGASGQDQIAASPLRPFVSASYGSLIVHAETADRSDLSTWTQFKGQIARSGAAPLGNAVISFRINEADTALADNVGALTVCLHYQ